MKSPTRRVLVAALLATTCHAQNLEFRGLETPTATPSGWGIDGEQPYAQIHYGEAPGETTLLFAHVTIDSEVASAAVAKGIVATYPFFVAPDATWNTSHAALAALPISFTGTQQDLYIPPERLAGHLSEALSQNLTTNWGTHNPASSAVTRQLGNPATWFSQGVGTLSNFDERRPWATAVCWPTSGTNDIMNVEQLGRQAVEMAAWWHLKYTNILLDQDGLDALDEYLDKEVGFQINIQAAHVKPTGGGLEVRLSQRIKIRRRSLGQVQQDPWWMIMGPGHFLPSIVNSAEGIYLGARGGELHVAFPSTVAGAGLRALMLVDSSDGWIWSPQLENPNAGGVVLRPEIGVFSCPTDAVSGIVYFFDAADQLVVPEQSVTFGAFVMAYDPD